MKSFGFVFVATVVLLGVANIVFAISVPVNALLFGLILGGTALAVWKSRKDQ